MKMALITTGLVVITFLLLLFWMAGGLQLPKRTQLKPLAIDTNSEGNVKSSTTSISALSWNIAWAYGQGSEGSGKRKSPEQMKKHLLEISNHIMEINADIVLLQEVDFDSDRSYNVDQAAFIAKKAGYQYLVRGESWSANYLPFPYWPPSEHWGQIVSGGAILSKLPIQDCEITLLPKPAAQSFFYRQFYLFRYLMRCEVSWQGRTLSIFNTHLEAFDLTNREKQTELVTKILSETSEKPSILGGDFNTVPREAKNQHAYPDEPETDHRNDRTLQILMTNSDLQEAAAQLPTPSVEERYTFPATEPNRQLDHFFNSPQVQAVDFEVSNKTCRASDHLPILSRFVFLEE